MSDSGKSGGGARQRPGSRAKTGKPRPGTGGYGRKKLEGKGPTPSAEQRPGHPAQRRATRAEAAAKRPDATRTGPGTAGIGSGRQPGQAGLTGTARVGGPGRSSQGATVARGSAGPAGKGTANATEIVAGRSAVLDALRAGVPALALHVGPRLDADERIGEAVKLAADSGIAVVEAGRSELDRMTGGLVHQGLVLRIQAYRYAHAADLTGDGPEADEAVPPLIVALDGVTDPVELGAVVRSVAAFGGTGVVIPVRRSAEVTATAWRTSAGAVARVQVAQVPNLSRTLAAYAEAGLFVVGIDTTDAGAGPADDGIGSLALADRPLVLVLGPAGKGLSRLVEQQCDAVVALGVSRGESLTSAVAAGIALHQVSRLRAGQLG